jgi:cytochrome c peroxidase
MERVYLALILLVFTSTVLAEQHTVTEEDTKFSEPFLKVGINDTVRFINNDGVTHNISIRIKNSLRNYGKLPPGKDQIVDFPQAGVYDITCSIHPDMKMTVFARDNILVSTR